MSIAHAANGTAVKETTVTIHQQTQGPIVVGVDGSTNSKDALSWAIQQATLTGATVRAVSVWHRPNGLFTPAEPGARLLLPDLEQNAVAELAEVVTEAGATPGVELEQRVVEGHPIPVLLEQAEDASLLVLGSRGRGAFTGMLLGSVSEHCVSHAPCPVAVVRPADLN
jgi:nucleotide-binding universal stress UspA family protein